MNNGTGVLMPLNDEMSGASITAPRIVWWMLVVCAAVIGSGATMWMTSMEHRVSSTEVNVGSLSVKMATIEALSTVVRDQTTDINKTLRDIQQQLAHVEQSQVAAAALAAAAERDRKVTGR